MRERGRGREREGEGGREEEIKRDEKEDRKREQRGSENVRARESGPRGGWRERQRGRERRRGRDGGRQAETAPEPRARSGECLPFARAGRTGAVENACRGCRNCVPEGAQQKMPAVSNPSKKARGGEVCGTSSSSRRGGDGGSEGVTSLSQRGGVEGWSGVGWGGVGVGRAPRQSWPQCTCRPPPPPPPPPPPTRQFFARELTGTFARRRRDQQCPFFGPKLGPRHHHPRTQSGFIWHKASDRLSLSLTGARARVACVRVRACARVCVRGVRGVCVCVCARVCMCARVALGHRDALAALAVLHHPLERRRRRLPASRAISRAARRARAPH